MAKDLEDSVPKDQKETCRHQVSSFLKQNSGAILEKGSTAPKIIVRVNSLSTGLMEKDMESVVASCKPEVLWGISVGKVETVKEIDQIDDCIGSLEGRFGFPEGSIKLLPWIETSLGVLNAAQILARHSQRLRGGRVVASCYGADDLRASLGLQRSDHPSNTSFIEMMRMTIVLHSIAAQVQPLDTPWVDIPNIDGLQHYAEASKEMGFKGMFSIHPTHIPHLNEAFSSSNRPLLVKSIRICQSFLQAVSMGKASVKVDGAMIDIPAFKQSLQLLREHQSNKAGEDQGGDNELHHSISQILEQSKDY